MQSVNRLGLKAALITGLVLVVLYGSWWGIRQFFGEADERKNELAGSEQAATSPDPVEQDTDKDGLPDLVENLYRTNPKEADTDQDGTPDNDEIMQGRDPATSGPNDVLGTLPTGSNVQVLGTYTQRYLATLPENAAREEVLDKERIEAFVNANKGSLLPPVAEDTVKVTAASGKEAVAAYLAAISSTHNPSIHTVTSSDIETAYRLHYAAGQSEQIQDVIAKLEENVANLTAREAPEETREMHARLVAASQALLDNTKRLQDMPNDFIGGLIGAKNIEELGVVFQGIAQEIQQLEVKYSLI